MTPLVGIIGGGSVGCGLAAVLSSSGVSTQVYGRAGLIEQLPSVYASGCLIPQPNLATLPADAMNIWLLTTKAHDLSAALLQYAPQMAADSIVVSLCNGLVSETLVQTADSLPLERERLRLGVCRVGARQHERTIHLSNLAPGMIIWGPLAAKTAFTSAEAALAELTQIISLVPEPFSAIHDKWLMNVVINVLCAYLSLPRNGELLHHDAQVRAVLNEAYHLGETLWGPWAQSLDEKYQHLRALLYATQDNENSMYRDVLLGRRTEAEFLLGVMLNKEQFPLLAELRRVLLENGNF